MVHGLPCRTNSFRYVIGVWSVVFACHGLGVAAEPLLQVNQRLTHHNAAVSAVQFSPSGSELATVDCQGVLVLWDVRQQKMIIRLQLPEGDWNSANLQWNASGDTLLCWADMVGAVVIERKQFRQKTLFSRTVDLKGIDSAYSCTQALKLSAQGTHALWGANGIFQPLVKADVNPDDAQQPEPVASFLALIELKTGAVQQFSAPFPIFRAYLTEEGRFLAVDFQGALLSGDLREGLQVKRIPRPRGDQMMSINTFGAMAVTPEGSKIVLGGTSGQFELFQNAPLRKIRTFNMPTIKVKPDQVSPLLNADQLAVLLNTVCAVAISADGSRSAAGMLGGGLQLWDNQSGKLLQNLKFAPISENREESARAICFVPQSNQRLLVSTAESSLYLFDTRQQTRFMLDHAGPFDVTRDGKQLAVSIGSENAVRIYQIPD